MAKKISTQHKVKKRKKTSGSTKVSKVKTQNKRKPRRTKEKEEINE